ncbi:efflux RND transporter periplasmic adaptor subunit [Hydrogenophaga borbori]|uniref:efflux RND transporter periplasmic adaptor subunit n=1 Tax=Hydrogenophaga borbori TaxID=2294117 RepID=UPI00301C5FBE
MSRPSTKPSSLGRIWLPIAALAAISAAAFAIAQQAMTAQASAPAEAAPPPLPVSVATVAESDVTLWDEFSGRLEAVERVEVRSRVAGAVLATHFREGALVAKGALLVSIDPAPYEAEVARAEAQASAAQARLSHASGEFARSQRLWQDKAIAQRELDDRQNALREAEANLQAARAQVQAARLNLGYTQVRAPVAGRIGKVDVTAGNLVAAGPGAPVLTTLVSVNPIYASFDADEQTVARALQGLNQGGASARRSLERIPVRMGTAGDADTPFTGRLQLIDNQVDPRSGTVRVRAVFDNADGTLMPGQFARIRMAQPRSAHQLLVSERAIGTDQDKKFVLVVGQDNKAEYREVALGASVDGLRSVLSGLKAGERIVVNGLQRVRPGALVQPQPVPMNQARVTSDAQELAAKQP